MRKKTVFQNHFEATMRQPNARARDFQWDALHLTAMDLGSRQNPFSESKVLNAIKQIPQDKAPGPDGFTGLFYKVCWPVIRLDVLAAINSFYNLRCADLNLVNKANIVLVLKKEDADTITDYRPISLIHSFAKLIAKLMALRLTPHMDSVRALL